MLPITAEHFSTIEKILDTIYLEGYCEITNNNKKAGSYVPRLPKRLLKSLFSALKTTYSCQKVTLLSPNYTKEGGGGGRGVTDLGHTSIFLFTASLIKNLFGLSRGPQPQSPSLGQVGNKVLSAKGEIILNY